MSPESVIQVVWALSALATAVMSASAAIQAVRHDMDVFGAAVLGVAAAVGGGTLRDLLLGRTPVFWIDDLTYLLTAVPIAIVSYFAARMLPSGNGRRHRLLMQCDAVGLALFTLIGVRVALEAGTSGIIAVVIGCVTGTVGGMIRDVLCNVTPSVLKEDLYATISLLGGGAYIGLAQVVDARWALAFCFLSMLAARLVVIYRTQFAS